MDIPDSEGQKSQPVSDAPAGEADAAPRSDASARTLLMPPPDFNNGHRGEPVKPDEELFVSQNRTQDPGALTQMQMIAAPTVIMPAPNFAAEQATQNSPASEPAPPPAATPVMDEKIIARLSEPAVAAPAAVAAPPISAPPIDAYPDVPIVPTANRVSASLAPAPDSPFGGAADTSPPLMHTEGVAGHSRVRVPMPSGANWRFMMDHVPVAPPKPVLVAKGLVKRFGSREVVRGVEVEVGAGEIVGLLGRNGAGKTTTFRMIMGLLHPDGGSVMYENRDVTRLPMYARANRGIGYLAQSPSIFQKLTVEQNLMAVLELQEGNRRARNERMEELIKNLGLATVRKQQAAILSGGERRRLEIARAMSLRPRVVLFDEPFAGIDPITVTEIQGIIRNLKNQGVGVLLTDHNVRETLTITDRTYIMDEGKIWIHGHPRDIVQNEEARSRYLGHEFRLDF